MNTPIPTPSPTPMPNPVRDSSVMNLRQYAVRFYRQDSIDPTKYTGVRGYFNIHELISNAVAEAQNSPSPQSTQIAQLQQSISQAQGEVDSLESVVAQLQTSVSQNQTTDQQQQTSITQLQGKVVSLETLTAQLQSAANPSNTQLNSSITQLNNTTSQLQQSLSGKQAASPRLTTIAGFNAAGLIKSTTTDPYASLLATGSFGESLLATANLTAARQLLGITDSPIVVSTTEPANAATGLIWVELVNNGVPKYTWIRRGNQWFTLEPLYTSYSSDLINSLLRQQLPLNLPCGCGSIYFDGFQATVYVTSKLLTGLGYIITPQYLNWQGVAQSFPNNPNINTQPYAANSVQVLNPLQLATTLTLAQVSSLYVDIGPVGIPGSIRINCSFRYYGIRG